MEHYSMSMLDNRMHPRAEASQRLHISPTSLTERLIYSESNYWIAMAADLIAAAVLLGIGITRHPGSALAAVMTIATGLLAWTCVEYGVHRWVLHGPPSIGTRAHARHHADGSAFIAAPAFLNVVIAAAAWALTAVILSAASAALLIGGLFAGYNYYVLRHHIQHRRPSVLPALRRTTRLERAHQLHHRRHVVNFGVSTLWWDRLLGTYRP